MTYFDALYKNIQNNQNIMIFYNIYIKNFIIFANGKLNRY